MKTRLHSSPLAVAMCSEILHYAAAADVLVRNADEFHQVAAQAKPGTLRGLKAGDQHQVAGIPFCWCPPGTFIMGGPPDEPERRYDHIGFRVVVVQTGG